ncbi:MAG: zinc-dependent peptidase [bacterium]|nr:zinc-dependent peptidase [bacterium]
MIGYLAFIIGLLLLYWVWRTIARRRERARLLALPFSEEWRSILARNVPLFGRLDAGQKERLEHRVQRFLVDFTFEGCGGLEIDDEIRVTIAGQACMLLLGRDQPLFPKLRSILVYPSTYRARDRRMHDGGFVEEGGQSRLGESWGQGYVVLAWDAVLHGASDLRDGHNVVLHEFAHQLDQEDGAADGVPLFDHPPQYSAWARVLERDFEKLVARVSRGRRTVIDAYGATNKAEFFAVATETFFEKPRLLEKRYPELYELLREFYGLDPGDWQGR